MSNILIIDDHEIVREGIGLLLENHPFLHLANEASNAQEALELLKTNTYDAIILDISLPDISGLDLLKIIKEKYSKTPVLVFTMHSEEQYAIRTIKAGASGFLNKGHSSKLVIEALTKLISGGKYISPSIVDKLMTFVGSPSDKLPHETLSDREFQVFQLIAQGKTNKEIAEELFLSERTISTYKTRILQKIGLTKSGEIIHYAIEHDLI